MYGSERICTYRKGKQRKRRKYDGNKDHNSRKIRNDYTVAVWEHCFKGSIAEVYELVETPEETGLGRCECRISRIGRKEGFEDAGHAMAWALTNVK